jgi:hypothetical protein
MSSQRGLTSKRKCVDCSGWRRMLSLLLSDSRLWPASGNDQIRNILPRVSGIKMDGRVESRRKTSLRECLDDWFDGKKTETALTTLLN